MRALAAIIVLTGCTTADHEIDDVKGRFCVFSNPEHRSAETLESALFQNQATDAPQAFRAGDPLALRIQVADERFTNSGTCTPIREASCDVDYANTDRSSLTVRSRLAWDDYDGACTREAFYLTIVCTTHDLRADAYDIDYRGDALRIDVPGTTDVAPCVGDERD
jgi:hypothetical protein